MRKKQARKRGGRKKKKRFRRKRGFFSRVRQGKKGGQHLCRDSPFFLCSLPFFALVFCMTCMFLLFSVFGKGSKAIFPEKRYDCRGWIHRASRSGGVGGEKRLSDGVGERALQKNALHLIPREQRSFALRIHFSLPQEQKPRVSETNRVVSGAFEAFSWTETDETVFTSKPPRRANLMPFFLLFTFSGKQKKRKTRPSVWSFSDATGHCVELFSSICVERSEERG